MPLIECISNPAAWVIRSNRSSWNWLAIVSEPYNSQKPYIFIFALLRQFQRLKPLYHLMSNGRAFKVTDFLPLCLRKTRPTMQLTTIAPPRWKHDCWLGTTALSHQSPQPAALMGLPRACTTWRVTTARGTDCISISVGSLVVNHKRSGGTGFFQMGIELTLVQNSGFQA